PAPRTPHPAPRPMLRLRALAVPLAVLLAAAAAAHLRASPAAVAAPACAPPCADSVQVTYLGVGGWLIRRGPDAVLTAPFFSTPRLSSVSLARPIRADTARIDERVRALLPGAAGLRAVLVGHSHYDHLMDVPYLARRHLPGVPVYGNAAMLRLLAADPVRPRLVSVEEDAGTHEAPGRWIYPHPDSTVRFMALRSGHAPHALGVKVFRRGQAEERGALPSNAWEWAEGTVLAYVIDFLDRGTGRVAYRVHFQDAASEAPLGFPPPWAAADSARFDLAILCAGSFHEAGDYPAGIVGALRPREVLVGHWEDFFRPQTARLRLIPGTDTTELLRRVDTVLPLEASRAVPRPGATLRFPVHSAGEPGSPPERAGGGFPDSALPGDTPFRTLP
ncbi:MAG TPA: MBL fold metallo-hydrolase, partial [Longimicrobiaceae bacterium]|nr:MBL fold metallo-hydrolase [Longimicrobiaceae bacterium]